MRSLRNIAPAIAVLMIAVGCGDDGIASGGPRGPDEGSTDCPLETRAPNASGQNPAFASQTRACGVASEGGYNVTVVASGLEHPWAVEPLPGGDLLVTERPGRMRVITASGQVSQPITGLPQVDAVGQGGLLDVALSPNFATDRTIFWSYAEPRQGGNGTAVARGVLSADGRSVSEVSVIFRATPTYDGQLHFGSRLAFGPDGSLYISTGERSDTPMRMHAQELDNTLGKIMRILPDGSVPQDNPFVGQSGAQPEVWSYGHRSPQAMGFDAQGRLWEIEHGTRGGDEVNLIERGGNFGWPIQAYGIEYGGGAIQGAQTARAGTVQPVYYWDPVIAPSGMQWYAGSAFPEWQGDLFVGGMQATALVRLVFENDRVVGEEHLLKDRGKRIRDVREAPDGSLFVVTDEDNGELLRISPR
jgi:glucose/arabinose dehydrogenase